MPAGRRRPVDWPASADLQCRDRSLALVGSQAAALKASDGRFRQDAERILRAGVAGVDPEQPVARACEAAARRGLRPSDVHVLAAGKAADGMVRGLLAVWPSPPSILIAAPRTATNSRSIPHARRLAVGHPDPDEQSVRAGEAALALARALPAGHRLIVLLSGGASAMLAAPVPQVELAAKRQALRALMDAGVPIAGLNAVRKHLSRIKGGWLGLAAGWRVITLAVSDVHAPVADDPAVIGSGPTVPDPTTFADALRIVRDSGADIPAAVREHLEAGARGTHPDTPKTAGLPLEYEVVCDRRQAMEAAAAEARARGYDVYIVPQPTGGEARAAGEAFVEAAPLVGWERRPLCVIGSGETVVTVRGSGLGGRNQEFVLGAAGLLARRAITAGPLTLASAGTDGIDGPTEAAGGLADHTTIERARRAGIDLAAALHENASHPALAALGDLLVWGPTGTNVGDLHVLLAGPPDVGRPAEPPPLRA